MYPAIASGIAALLGSLALLGHWLDLARLVALARGPQMVKETAMMSALAGLSLWASWRGPRERRHRVIGRVSALAVATIAGATLLGYIAVELRGGSPVRPSLQTATAFLLLSVAMLLGPRMTSKKRVPADYLALGAGLIALSALAGYLFGVPRFYGSDAALQRLPYIGMSMQTAVAVLALSTGILATHIERGVLWVVVAEDPGGVAARQLLFGLLVFPPVSVVMLLGTRYGWYTLPVASAILLLVSLTEASAFIVMTARRLSRLDLTTRRATEALRLSEERVRVLVEEASDPIFVADRDGRLTEVNIAACDLLGFTRGELVGRLISDVIPPADVPRLGQFQQALEAGRVLVGEWTTHRRDGTCVSVEVSAKLLPDGRLQAIARDISDRKRAEQALAQAAETERRFHAETEALMRASTAVSESLAELTSSEIDSVLANIAEQARVLTGAQYAAVGVGTDPTRPFERWVTVGVSDEVERAIGRWPRPIGSLGYLLEHVSPLRVADVRAHESFGGFPPHHPEIASFLAVPIRHGDRMLGNLYLGNKQQAAQFSELDERLIGMLADRVAVTLAIANMYASEAIRRAWLRSVIDQLPEGVIVLDAAGVVQAMNRVLVSWATARTDAPGAWGNSTVFDVRHPDGRAMAMDDLPVRRALRTGETIQQELLIRQPDGRMLPIEANAAPVRDDQQRISGAVVVSRDVSDRKELERVREEWIAVIAHDLRQPINIILLSTDGLLEAASIDPDRQRRSVERIRECALRLDRMIEDMLDAARIVASQLTVELRTVDFVQLVRAALDNSRVTHPGVVVDLVAAPYQLARVDPDRIHQVLGNLLSNAVKYGTPGTPIEVSMTRGPTMIEVCVANHGPEIPPDELDRLFSRFARTTQAKASGTPGIGLGLYISKGLVEAHGGRMWVEHEQGKTRFLFTVPMPSIEP